MMDDEPPQDNIENYENEINFGEGEIEALDLEPVVKNFEEYDKKPFLSFTNAAICEEETEELVFGQFKEWLITCQTEGFLYTFEPQPSLQQLSLGKCPYLHTGLTCKERLEQQKRIQQEEKMKQELEEFLRKRLRLVQRLLVVYKKAKKGIEEEFAKNLTNEDPLCQCKRKMATKKIVNMMIKQFALEYLYFKSMKIKKEIELTNCYLIDTGRSRHLKNIYKYTLRTAEKLRCLLEKECSDESAKNEKFFEESTLRDMARMYLNEIENMAASVPYFSTEEWSSEHFWEGTTSSEGGPPDYECLSDFFESSNILEDVQKETDASSEILSETVEEEQRILPASSASMKQDDIMDDETKLLQEEAEKPHRIIAMDEEGYKTILHPEESQFFFEDIKKEILKSDYSLVEESSGELKAETEEDIRVTLLEQNKAEVEMLEEFKRELWLLESFHVFTTKLRPELSGKFKLIHFNSIYNEPVNEEAEKETVSSDIESSIDTDLNNCLLNLKLKKSDVISSLPKPKLLDSSKGETLSSGDDSNPQYPDWDIPYIGGHEGSILMEEAQGEMDYELLEQVDDTPQPLNEREMDVQYLEYIKNRSSLMMMGSVHNYQESARIGSYLSGIAVHLEAMNSGQDSMQSQETQNEVAIHQSFQQENNTSIDRPSFHSVHDSRTSSDRVSIPSFSGSRPDSLKKYEQCIKQRELGIFEDSGSQYLQISVSSEFKDIDESSSTLETRDNNAISKSELNVKSVKSNMSAHSSASKGKVPMSNELTDSTDVNDFNGGDKALGEMRSSKCFPTLLEVMEYFTKTVKGESISVRECTVQEEEEELEHEEEREADWSELMNFKWSSSVEKRVKDPQVQCEFNSTKFLETLRKSNNQYTRNHPEMSAIISLILREFSLKKPESHFVAFIRDTVFNKHFAKKLTSYLAVNNKAYQRRMNICEEDSIEQLKKKAPNMFNFDKPSSDYWKEWGVDYKSICEKFGPQADLDVCASGDSQENYEGAQVAKDTWDLARMLEDFDREKKIEDRGVDSSSGWTRFNKKLAKEEMRDLMKEKTRVTALANEVDWGLPPDLRSSCQKMFLKRYIIDRKKP